MTNEILERIMETHILSLFPGATVTKGRGNERQRKFAVFSKGQTEIRVKAVDGEAFFITRPQPFTKQELKVVHDIVGIAEEYSDLNFNTQMYLNASSLSRIVARSLVDSIGDSDFETLVSSVIDTLEKWSAQTYEGNRIATSFGIDPSSSESENNFGKFAEEDFAKVLTNGYDTIVEFSSNGSLHGYVALDDYTSGKRAPFRYAAFCDYTRENEKYAFILNRNGEILVFRSGELVFAKRRGEWRLFTHESVETQLAFGSRKANPDLQSAIYESALDVSFARCGGCIGFVQKSKIHTLRNDRILKDSDLLDNGSDMKTKSLKKFIGGKKFHQLDRRVRQEILGIDGATVIDYEGTIVAAGAILNISQADTMAAEGGARLAAAKSLKKYGYSLKISADGEIRAFGKSKEFRFG